MAFNPIVAKLLATENLTVMQANVKTACFDVAERVLLIPMLKPVYDRVYGMLTAHECGHALFTDEDFNKIFLAATSLMKQYYNVCEDVRVEKLIKRKYPGLRRVMAEGYEVFNANNYFLPKNVDVNELTLIDRINARFKIGHICGVRFTLEEQILVDEVEAAETSNEVIEVSRKIYAFAKADLRKEKQKPVPQPKVQPEDSADEGDSIPPEDTGDSIPPEDIGDSDESTVGDSDDSPDGNKGTSDDTSDSKVDDQKSDADSCSNASKNSNDEASIEPEMTDEEIDAALQSLTQRALDGGLEDAADMKTTVTNLSLETKFAPNVIYSYKHILKNFNPTKAVSSCSSETYGAYLEKYNLSFEKFLTGTNKVVSHMVKEFEMKKCAHRHQRASVSKTGRLDVSKLFAYKLKDELFKSITVTPDDKNHGMVFLVDWSGSMDKHLKDTLCQLMSLAMFCRKVKIPFMVLAFSDSWKNEKGGSDNTYRKVTRDTHSSSLKVGTLMSGAGYDLQLLELMSDKMNEREFTYMMKLLHSKTILNIYNLGGTPLNAALVYMHSFVKQYKKENNVEKLTFVVLTDGEGEPLTFKTKEGYGGLQSYNEKIFKVLDPTTRNVYDVKSASMTPTLLRMIGPAAECSVVGFYVCDSHDVIGALGRAYPGEYHDSARIATVKKAMSADGYATLVNCGYDKQHLISVKALKEVEYVAKYNENMSASALARELLKMNDVSVSNKVLMGCVIGEFAQGKVIKSVH